MTLITDDYRDQMRQMHVHREDFGKASSKWAPMVFELCDKFDTTDVLDYGCGKGELNLHLPFSVRCYDPGIPKYSHPPAPADIVVCTDVLEHIEPDLLDDVLRHLAASTKKALVLCICCRKAVKTLPDGRNAHLIIQQPLWWQEQLAKTPLVDWELPGGVQFTHLANNAVDTATWVLMNPEWLPRESGLLMPGSTAFDATARRLN